MIPHRIAGRRLPFLHTHGGQISMGTLVSAAVVGLALSLYDWRMALVVAFFGLLLFLRSALQGWLKAILYRQAYLTISDRGGRQLLINIYPRGKPRVLDGTLRFVSTPSISTVGVVGAAAISFSGGSVRKPHVNIIDRLLPDSGTGSHQLLIERPDGLTDSTARQWYLEYRHRPVYACGLTTRWALPFVADDPGNG